MQAAGTSRVLILAHRTAATPALIDAVRERCEQGAAEFTLVVPNLPHGLHKVVDPEDTSPAEAQLILDLALPLLEEACDATVEGIIGDANPLSAVMDAINLHGPFDEIILSTLPHRVSRWLKMDLPSKLAGIGLPVTTITAPGRRIPSAGSPA